MKRILVPTDFSDCAKIASKYAINLATKLNCELEFLHILSTPIDWLKVSLDKEKMYPEVLERIRVAKNELNSLVAEAKDKKINAKSSLVFNLITEDIAAYINASEYELIIIGSHGASGVKEKIIGSNAQKVIRNSTLPVLVLKNKPNGTLSKAVFVSDFEDYSVQAFHKLTAIADKINMKTQLLYVNIAPNLETTIIDSKMDELLKSCDRKEKCSKHIVNSETIESGINVFAKEENIDLVCICTHGKNSLMQLFTPSVTESLANHIELPLLSIRM